METEIYYYGIDPMAVEYLKSQRFRDRLAPQKLEPIIKTASTAITTNIQFRRETKASLLLITSKQKKEWENKEKAKKYFEKETVATIDAFDDLESVLQRTYDLAYDPKLSAIDYLNSTNPEERAVLQESLAHRAKALDEDKPSETTVVQEPAVEEASPFGAELGQAVSGTTESRPTSHQVPEHPQSSSPVVAPKTDDPPSDRMTHPMDGITLTMEAGTETVKDSDREYSDDTGEKRSLRTSDQGTFTVIQYEGSEVNATAIEQIFDVSGFEVSATKESQDLQKYKARIKDLQHQLQELAKDYATYQSRESIQSLIDSYTDLTERYEELQDQYDDLIANGNPSSQKALDELKEQLASANEEKAQYKQDNEGLYKSNNQLLSDKRDLETTYHRLQQEFEQYKDTQAKQMESFQEKDSFSYMQENIRLSEANQQLRRDYNDAISENKQLERENSRLKQGMFPDNASDDFQLSQGKRYTNVIAIVGLGDEALREFYYSILPSPEMAEGKDTLIDLSRSSSLLKAFNLHTVHNPINVLQKKSELVASLSKATAKQSDVHFQVLTTGQHGLPRGVIGATDWDQLLDQANRHHSLLFLGNVEDTEVFNLVKAMQDKQLILTIVMVLPPTVSRAEMFNLIGLHLKNLHFLGEESGNYGNSLPIQSTYRSVFQS